MKIKKLVFIVATIMSFLGCVKPAVTLVHPQSGDTIQCSGNNVDNCVQEYEAKGYGRVNTDTSIQHERNIMLRPAPGGQTTVIQGGGGQGGSR